MLPVGTRQHGSGFNLGRRMSRYDESLTLIRVLDHLRDAYDLAKNAGRGDIQDHLMEARRELVQALHQSLNLHSQLAEAQDRPKRQAQKSPIKGEHPIAVLTPMTDATMARRTS
jgi:hypothetical protein